MDHKGNIDLEIEYSDRLVLCLLLPYLKELIDATIVNASKDKKKKKQKIKRNAELELCN